MLITNANRYGLTKGSYAAEHLELTEDGRIAVDDTVSRREQTRVRAKLAIETLAPFKHLYDRFTGTKLPAKAVLIDAIKESGVSAEYAEEGVDTFIVNLKFVGLLRTLSGAERIVGLDHLLDHTPAGVETAGATKAGTEGKTTPTAPEQGGFDTTCFYITAIGEQDSDERRHSDLFLGSIVEPALSQFGLKVVRADEIDKPGMITRQVIEYLLRSRLVVADLSFHNPNVFYELAIRHAVRLPIVQIIRFGDKLPFDVQQMRTIIIDSSTVYTLVPKIESYQAEIASQVRRVLDAGSEVDTPISIFFPDLKVTSAGSTGVR